jgi:hypothetical protein
MIKIDFPDYRFRIKEESGKEFIFDSLRKLWVTLTPEEWVRQNIIRYLLDVKKYPGSLIAIEKEMWLGELKKRFDVLVYNTSHQPWLMIECKSMEVVLDEKVLQQLLRYNIAIPVSYLVITNGRYTCCFEKMGDGLEMKTEIPSFM